MTHEGFVVEGLPADHEAIVLDLVRRLREIQSVAVRMPIVRAGLASLAKSPVPPAPRRV